MADEFARIAHWWDREAMPRDKAALAALAYKPPELATCTWSELDGQTRWLLAGAMRYVVTEFGATCGRLVG